MMGRRPRYASIPSLNDAVSLVLKRIHPSKLRTWVKVAGVYDFVGIGASTRTALGVSGPKFNIMPNIARIETLAKPRWQNFVRCLKLAAHCHLQKAQCDAIDHP